jgi:prepilin-type N-terminal cleavage/methylation domain-containing protein
MKLLRNRPTGRVAFTLIEVIVCTAIIGITFVSLYAGIGSSFSVVNAARENLRANQILVEKLETIRLYSWEQINSNGFIPATFQAPFFPSSITNVVGTNSDGTLQTTVTNIQAGNLIYYGTVNIGSAPVSEGYSNTMRLVTVSLSWTNGSVVRAREMQTLVGENGMQNYIYR